MRSICPLCEATCGIEVFMEDGLPESVRGDDADLFSQGYICPKGVALVELSEDPDRLREPMIREGDHWKTVSWKEAFARVDEGWKKLWAEHGKESLGVYMGNPVSHSTSMSLYGTGLVKMLGTPNFFTASTVDQIPKHVSSGYLFGHPMSIPIPDIDHSDYLLILGANPLESNGSLMTAPNLPGRLKALQKRGGSLVVIDPRRTKTAKLADRYHPIRPGSDALFLAAIVYQLFAEDRVVADGAIALCEGVAAIRKAVQPFSPERVAPHCDMAPEAIVQIARELFDAPSAAIHARFGTCAQAHGTINSWLVDVIHIITGNLDRTGGALFTKAAHGPDNTKGVDGIGRGFVTGRRKSRVSGHPEVMGEFPCAAMAEEITTPGPGQIRGMLTMGGNPVLSTPDGARLDKALASLDFMVSFDVYLNETTRHAHVILPDVSPFERTHYDLPFRQLAIHNHARHSPPLMAPFDRPKDWEVLLQLVGIAAGMGSKADLDLLDEQGVRQAIGREQRRKNTRIGDMDADAILETLSPHRGPERLLDFLLRTGPYGDAFGKNDEGITLAALFLGGRPEAGSHK
ncbi:MAG: molybdopterin-dependent oxidoreductase [Candidatus Hydrogenedentes bacterium]|nr:molybdopterin-dependent oxidoreductase [Candidatus Hydrogenedentota bacterium]